MRFTRTSEQQDMAEAVGDLLGRGHLPALARDWAQGDVASWWALWQKLASMGVTGVAIPESHGGLGTGPVELAACLEELGYAGMPGPVVETLAAIPKLVQHTGVAEPVLSRVGSGEAIATVAFTDHGGLALDADRSDYRYLCVGDAAYRATPDSDGQPSFDPARRMFALRRRDEALEGADADAAFLHGAFGCAAQLLGIGRRLLDLSLHHVRQRHQFGRPIGEFQAVKHHLADVRIALDFARPVVNGAALALRDATGQAARDVSAAKIVTADAAHRAARVALQVHGAIGYTVEHDLHLWSTKATTLRSAWGTPSWHRHRVAEALATSSELPIGGA
ncbi:acyl-CoA dehydrogenase [Allosaccharopolyspora coralli]|uniref:Acyl-CoA dehydrogenase n=1 Tax=Allosaccharopolyspora coralli TaxID=2665642 RepID=A0A5Q3QFN7_9PSEU|nr:acyl-CoA dehydrogenase family protein [Allosaccharopolyspora coralli]QGK70345.1 acyl-CoA dehydrogenase [Allosaccharopolyspora coralli]